MLRSIKRYPQTTQLLVATVVAAMAFVIFGSAWFLALAMICPWFAYFHWRGPRVMR